MGTESDKEGLDLTEVFSKAVDVAKDHPYIVGSLLLGALYMMWNFVSGGAQWAVGGVAALGGGTMALNLLSEHKDALKKLVGPNYAEYVDTAAEWAPKIFAAKDPAPAG